ncbi:MFS transporter [Niallia circulans]|uniref:MFS transporter n=1 Tax=Niallia circulans TaxID=1397 RepID=A0A553SGC0_NIACI|nr:MFS transporter [Niallia circulans]TRZ36036.1 MFS transporter [Niallia circulans]
MTNKKFAILISIVSISGFSQGMLLPLIAVIFEGDGLSSSLNGLNAVGLYMGILLISPFMEYPLRKYGYKPAIVFGGLLVIISLAMFPLWKTFWFWFFLRLLIGIGDHALHFATQTWITTVSSEKNRGRNISLYGVFFGIGFAAGPLMTPLVKLNEAIPFILSSVLCFAAWIFTLFLKNDFPRQTVETNSFKDTISRFSSALKYAWAAFLPPLAYGFLESSLNSSFPVYGLRLDFQLSEISILLTCFSIGAIVFQFPLGILSDSFGRRRTLITILFVGFVCFLSASFVEQRFIGLAICLFIAGMAVGSTFSLGVSYMTDLVPTSLLPTGNLLCGMAFSIGSLTGPYLGGLFIQYVDNLSYFLVISTMLLLLGFIIFISAKQRGQKQANTVPN